MNVIKINGCQATLALDPQDCALLHEACETALIHGKITAYERSDEKCALHAMSSALKACFIATKMQEDIPGGYNG